MDEASRRSAAAVAGSTVPTASRARLSWRCASQAPGLQLVVRGLARGEVRGIGRRRGERRVEPRDQRPDVRRHVRRPLQRHAARCRDEIREELRRPLGTSSAPGTKAWSIATRGHAAVAGHGLRPAGEARDAGEPGLLREVGGQLQVRVQARLQTPVGLEQQAVADDGRGARPVPAERRLVGRRRSRRPSPPTRPRTQATAGRPAPRPPGRVRVSPSRRQGADRATRRDRGRQGAPGPVTLDRLAHDAVADHQRDGVAVPVPVILPRHLVHEGQRRIRREGERVGEAPGGGRLVRCGIPPG